MLQPNLGFPIVRLLKATDFLSLFSMGQFIHFRIIMYEQEFRYQKNAFGR